MTKPRDEKDRDAKQREADARKRAAKREEKAREMERRRGGYGDRMVRPSADMPRDQLFDDQGRGYD